jgi:hypothetical protein
MTPLEQHWDRLRSMLHSIELTETQWGEMRQTFYSGCFAMFLTMAELNNNVKDDTEFDRRMNDLFREALSGIVDRFKLDKPELRRRH